MTNDPLTPERILDAAEEVLRRYGPSKANVVDVARALGVSHGSVYRHFPNKVALRDAVASRWLARVSAPLKAIAQEEGPAADRLTRWLYRLVEIKRRKVLEDPELFATYHAIAEDSREVVGAHVVELVDQLAHIIEDGCRQGEFHVADSKRAARAFFNATLRFHHPRHSEEWHDPAIDEELDAVFQLLMTSLCTDNPEAPAGKVAKPA